MVGFFLSFRFEIPQVAPISVSYEMDRLGLLLHLTCTKGQVKVYETDVGAIEGFRGQSGERGESS
jgi:hypothetical protein